MACISLKPSALAIARTVALSSPPDRRTTAVFLWAVADTLMSFKIRSIVRVWCDIFWFFYNDHGFCNHISDPLAEWREHGENE